MDRFEIHNVGILREVGALVDNPSANSDDVGT